MKVQIFELIQFTIFKQFILITSFACLLANYFQFHYLVLKIYMEFILESFLS